MSSSTNGVDGDENRRAHHRNNRAVQAALRVGHDKNLVAIRDGTLETVTFGKRRLIIIASYRRALERQQRGPPTDARRNTVVPALGLSKRPPAT
jgi:hypothetical protein